MKRILLVCLGNICRSPMAEAMLRHVLAKRERLADFEIDSAGTGKWHVGEAPDPRARRAMAQIGIDISAGRARQVTREDFARFDVIAAMDTDNFDTLRRMAPAELTDRVVLFLDFAPDVGRRDIPDPWFGGPEGFDHALELIRAAAQGLADHME